MSAHIAASRCLDGAWSPTGERGPNRTGLIVTIALHLLLVAVYLFQPKIEKHAPPKSGEAVVWLPPLKPQQADAASRRAGAEADVSKPAPMPS